MLKDLSVVKHLFQHVVQQC
uniref:Uncharacterized protein n=1 Tax=Rhizophora mucronata TaxID=61149 RepID=A0A2P2Q982_RHIMU